MSAPNSSDQPSEQLRAFVEGLNNFVCSDSDSGSDDGFVFTAVTTQQARDFISGKGKSDIVLGKGKSDIVLGKGKSDIGKGKSSDDPKCSNHEGNECHGIRQWFKCQHFQCYDTSKSILSCIECGEEDLEPKIKNIMADHPMLKNVRNEKDAKLISIMIYNKEGLKDDSSDMSEVLIIILNKFSIDSNSYYNDY